MKLMIFLPREKKFFHLYEDLAAKTVRAAELLEELRHNYRKLPEITQRLERLEDEADAVVHQIVNDLLYDHTRVTEEKGDIRFFAHNMDNIVDGIEKAVNRMMLYRLKKFPPAAVEFIPYLKKAVLELQQGIVCLRNLSKRERELTESCIRVNDLENKADQINRQWLSKIMARPARGTKDLRQIMAEKEILDLLEYAMDQCEDVANILETFRLKGAA